MRVDEFLIQFKPQMSEYCPVIITANGEVYETSEGHLAKLVELFGDNDILSKIPKDESPLLYLTARMGCVIVDYENQIYMEELTEAQKEAIDKLIAANLISSHLVKMTYKSALL